MLPQKLVFVQHDQRNGRLSHSNAVKAWSHVAKRGWEVRQFAIKKWKPEEHDLHSDNEDVADGVRDDQNSVLIPYSELQQAYASKSLRLIATPDCFGRIECFHYNTNIYVSQRRHFAPQEGTDRHSLWCANGQRLVTAGYAIRSGVNGLCNGNHRQAFACFEHAAQTVNTCFVNNGALDDATNVCVTMLHALCYARSREAHDIADLFLKQMGAIAVVIGGPAHPVAIMMKQLLVTDLTMDLLQRFNHVCFVASTVSEASTKVYKRNYHSFALKYDIFDRSSYSIEKAEYDYQKLLSGDSKTRYDIQFLSLSMARVYFEHGRFDEAADAVSDAPDQLVEWIERGWQSTTPRTAPLSMMGIAWRLSALAQATAGQGRHEIADAMFVLSISTARLYLEAGNPTLVQVQQAYSSYLMSRDRRAEAAEVDHMIDLTLKMYMLSP